MKSSRLVVLMIFLVVLVVLVLPDNNKTPSSVDTDFKLLDINAASEEATTDYGYAVICDNLNDNEDCLAYIDEFLLEKGMARDDFKIEINGNENQYIDYVFYVDLIRTEFGYSFLVQNNKLYCRDNTENCLQKVETEIKEILADGVLMKKYLAKEFITNENVGDLENEELMLFYSYKDKSLYAVHSYIDRNENGELYGVEKYYLLGSK